MTVTDQDLVERGMVAGLVDVVRSERKRWYDLRAFAQKRQDPELTAAMDAASQSYAERGRGLRDVNDFTDEDLDRLRRAEDALNSARILLSDYNRRYGAVGSLSKVMTACHNGRMEMRQMIDRNRPADT